MPIHDILISSACPSGSGKGASPITPRSSLGSTRYLLPIINQNNTKYKYGVKIPQNSK